MDQKRIRYVIPSYQRPKQLQAKTLNFLKHHKIPNEDISIVLRSDDEHLSEYQALGNGYLFHITSSEKESEILITILQNILMKDNLL
tara:strand:+ start:617 stop:877 length:261 start_codon:yes stop_codon:yes gene_type:complete